MKTSLFKFGKRFSLLSLIIISFGAISLIMLGNWQLARLKEKQDFIAKIKAGIANPPLEAKASTTLELYEKITLTGHFSKGATIFLYGRRSAYPEKDGYYILSPFEDNFGNIYLVSRAWVPQSLKNLVTLLNSGANETITAFVMPGETKSAFAPDNDTKNNIWFILDLQEAGNKLNLTITDFYLMQTNATNLPEGMKPLTSDYLAVVRNDHLEYAITWYSLAALLCGIYLVYCRKGCI